MEVLRSVSGVVGADFPWALSAKKRISKLVWESEKENKLFLHAFMKKKYSIFLPVDKTPVLLAGFPCAKFVSLSLSNSVKVPKQQNKILILFTFCGFFKNIIFFVNSAILTTGNAWMAAC